MAAPALAPAPDALRRADRRRVVLGALLVLAVLAIRPVRAHLRAASLLLRFADDHATGALADLGRHEVVEELAPIGDVPARVYAPRDAGDYPGIVLLHGVHRLAIEEPRLKRFARAIASSGVVVYTPEVREIADYTVSARSIDTIGAAARALHARLGGGRVGVMGMSFAGGLSLLAAADPRFSSDIGFVVAVGAHHDLGRVSRFFATDEVERPDGSRAHLKAHEYGALVLIYAHAESFFPPEDVSAARDALRFWLWEQHDDARACAEELGPASWAKMDALLGGHVDLLAGEMLDEIDRDGAVMAAVSPHGHLADLKVPVFLLHGEGDTVIPAAETRWIAAEVPPAMLREALVSPAIVHVELGADTPARQKWELVHFMAGVLSQADGGG